MSANPSSDRTGYNPLELIAELLHVGWLQYKIDHGVWWGPQRPSESKDPTKHPHICAWSDKDPVDRNQDRFQAALLVEGWMRGEITEHNLHEKIHDAWVQWDDAHERGTSYAKPYPEIHNSTRGPEEHEIQAKLLIPCLRHIPRRSYPSS